MPQPNPIQWFPGHMAKTRRLITENLSAVDVVIELLDARIPFSSRNPEIERLTQGKPKLTLLNKCNLADETQNRRWLERMKSEQTDCILTDCITGYGLKEIEPAVKRLCAEKLARYAEKGMAGQTLKAMVLGIPNVGKSSFINRACGNKKAKVEDRPGVTLAKQWVKTSLGIDLLDMPGVLWPKFEDQEVGYSLSMTGAIKDAVIDTHLIAIKLCGRLSRMYPQLVLERYKLTCTSDELAEIPDYELFELIARKRGHIISGGEINEDRCSAMLLDELRGGKLGRITLEWA